MVLKLNPSAQIQYSSFHCKCQKQLGKPIQNWLVILQRFSILPSIIQAPSFTPDSIIFHVLHWRDYLDSPPAVYTQLPFKRVIRPKGIERCDILYCKRSVIIFLGLLEIILTQ